MMKILEDLNGVCKFYLKGFSWEGLFWWFWD